MHVEHCCSRWKNGFPLGIGQFVGHSGLKYYGAWRDGKANGIFSMLAQCRHGLMLCKGRESSSCQKTTRTTANLWMGYRMERANVYGWMEPMKKELSATAVSMGSANMRYEGYFLDGVPHGSGYGKLRGGEWFRGEWQHGKPFNGQCVQSKVAADTFGDFVFIYKGSLRNGVWDGHGKLGYFEEKFATREIWTYDGEFAQGHCHGQGIKKHTLGWSYEGEWIANEMEGNGKLMYKSGEEIVGQFSHGRPHGKAIRKSTDGQYQDGTWSHGEFVEGKCKIFWDDGRIYEGQFRNRKIDGEGVMKWKDGTELRGIFENGNFPKEANVIQDGQEKQCTFRGLFGTNIGMDACKGHMPKPVTTTFLTETLSQQNDGRRKSLLGGQPKEKFLWKNLTSKRGWALLPLLSRKTKKSQDDSDMAVQPTDNSSEIEMFTRTSSAPETCAEKEIAHSLHHPFISRTQQPEEKKKADVKSIDEIMLRTASSKDGLKSASDDQLDSPGESNMFSRTSSAPVSSKTKSRKKALNLNGRAKKPQSFRMHSFAGMLKVDELDGLRRVPSSEHHDDQSKSK
eukprot:747574-Hanusia_phi.AAC.2